MQFIFNLIAVAAGIYSILIFIRIIFTWFGKSISGKPMQLISRITDPYLDWWRNTFNLRIGMMEISPVIAIAALSVVQNIFYALARFDRIKIGNLLAIVLLSVWPVISFVLIFFLIVIVLRLIAHLTNRNINSPFWKTVEGISQPVIYRINRFFLGKRIPRFINGIIISLLTLGVIRLGGGLIIPIFVRLLHGLPF